MVQGKVCGHQDSLFSLGNRQHNLPNQRYISLSSFRFDEIEKKIGPFLRSCGYNVKKGVRMVNSLACRIGFL